VCESRVEYTTDDPWCLLYACLHLVLFAVALRMRKGIAAIPPDEASTDTPYLCSQDYTPSLSGSEEVQPEASQGQCSFLCCGSLQCTFFCYVLCLYALCILLDMYALFYTNFPVFLVSFGISVLALVTCTRNACCFLMLQLVVGTLLYISTIPVVHTMETAVFSMVVAVHPPPLPNSRIQHDSAMPI